MNNFEFAKRRRMWRSIFWGFEIGFWACLTAIFLVVVVFLIYYPDG